MSELTSFTFFFFIRVTFLYRLYTQMGYIASSSIKRPDIGVFLTKDIRNASFFYSPEQHLPL